MNHYKDFAYRPQPHEFEKASYAYLVSILSFVVAIPLPIVNLVATLVYYLGIRKSTYFVRWHGIQAILTQLAILPFNSIAFWWFVDALINEESLSMNFWLYLIFVLIINATEFIASIITASSVRGGRHVRWWIYATITDAIVKPGASLNVSH